MNNTITNQSGKEFNLIQWPEIANMMDDELREELHNKLAPCSEQEFMTAYELAHEEKYGEEWEMSKLYPQW